MRCCEVLLCAPTSVRGNWLAGARDAGIAKVLSAVHASPGQPWTVARLARLASLSPSRFAARFRELVGCSPMTYVTSWRMSLAAQRLREGGDWVDEVGRALGYESHAAFSRAFRGHAGQPGLPQHPGQHRRHLVVGRQWDGEGLSFTTVKRSVKGMLTLNCRWAT